MAVKKKILVPIFYRGHYGRLRPVLRAIQRHQKLKLQIITAAQAAYGSFFANIAHSSPQAWSQALPWYIRARARSVLNVWRPFSAYRNEYVTQKLREDGFFIDACVPFFFDGGVPVTMAKSAGFGMMKIVDELHRLKPDMVFINADRFEMMAVAIAAAYLNIPIAHNEAGDVSGTIDESVRHAITKFAQIHFTSTDESRRRVIQMGERGDHVHAVGSPAIDALKDVRLDQDLVLGPVDTRKPFLLVLAHPVTTESPEENERMMRSIIDCIEELSIPTLVIGSNSDAQSDVVGKGMAAWHASKNHPYVHFTKHLHPDRFYTALSRAACALGNSSSFIREGAYFGTPAVLVGSRQESRERSENVTDVPPESGTVRRAVAHALSRGRYAPSMKFGDGSAGPRIADILAEAAPAVQKHFHDIRFEI